MPKKEQYDPQVYKRLELVRKQFQKNAEEQRKQQAAERRQEFFNSLARNKIRIGRIIFYAILAMVVLAVIGVVVSSAIAG